MSEVAVRVQRLGKRYRVGQREPYGSLRESLALAASGWLRRDREGRDGQDRATFWALRDVSLEVSTGEVLGIIGRNGAGKSTLLKVLSRITEPTTGRIEIYGRVGSLLEVGTGFHAELTGRENIYLSGAILGMSRQEIARKFDEIVDFAEVERFLDTPVKRYSSGMYVRLAFAVAAHLEPEVLVVDEVLAVGDAGFQQKCLGKMGRISREGRTVLFVSHNMAAVAALTDRCLWLEQGQVAQLGPTEDVTRAYLRAFAATSGDGEGWADLRGPEVRRGVTKQVAGEVRFEAVRLAAPDDHTTASLLEQEPLTLEIDVRADEPATHLEILCKVRTLEGQLVFTALSGQRQVTLSPGLYRTRCTVDPNPLRPGTYEVELYALTRRPQDVVPTALSFTVVGRARADEDPRYARDLLGLVRVSSHWGDVRPVATRTTVEGERATPLAAPVARD